MSDIDKMYIGSRRRLLSSNYNDGERLRDRALLESLSALSLGDVYKINADGIGGVIGGLTVRAIIGTNEIEVQPGIAVVAETPASATYDPAVQWIELQQPTRIDLDSLVDGGNPRLVTIEIKPKLVSKVNEIVDVFEPATGTFTTAFQDIVIGSEPEILLNAGPAGPSPVVAAGPGVNGTLPLSVVKLSAGQANFTDEKVAILMCRPMLTGGGLQIPMGTMEGGGLSVGEEAGGSFGVLGNADLSDIQLEMSGLNARARGTTSFIGTITARTPDTTDPTTLIGATAPVYGYAAPPPWALDYGDVAPREAWVDNPNNLPLVGTPESIVWGDGNTFTSLALSTIGDNGPLAVNTILVWDDVPPGGLDNNLLDTAPSRAIDRRGPHPNAPLTLDATQDPSWGAAQEVSNAYYVGAVSATGGQFVAQAYRGGGKVLTIDEVDIASGTGARPIRRDVANVVLTNFSPGGFPSMDQAGAEPDILPSTAITAELGIVFDGGAAFGFTAIVLGAAFGSGGPDPLGLGVYRVRVDNVNTPDYGHDAYVEVPLSRQGEATITAAHGGGSVSVVYLRGYTDVLLAQR